VNAAVRKIAASCSDSAARHQGVNLLDAEHLDVTVRALSMALDDGHRVPRESVDLLGTAEDPVELDEELVIRAR